MNRRVIWVLCISVALAAAVALGLELRILELDGGGGIVWTNDFTNAATYYILETDILDGSWMTNKSGAQNPGEITSNTVSVSGTQSFFTVRAEEFGSGVDAAEISGAVDLETNWTAGGHAYWFWTNSPSHGGGDSLQSGQIGHDEETWFGAFFHGPGDLRFWWKASVEGDPDTDYLVFSLDGTEKGRIWGEQDWTNGLISIPPGDHFAKWNYMRNSFGGGGQDACWVDEMSFTDATILILEGESIDVEMDEDGVPRPFDLELHAYVAGGVAQWSVFTQGLHGVASTNGGGSTNHFFAYVPDADYSGMDSFGVEVSDGISFDRITVNVTIVEQDDAPVITNGANVTVIMSEDTNPVPFSLTLTATDPDTPGGTLLWSIPRQPTSGVAWVTDAHGNSEDIGYLPPPDFRTHRTFWDIYTITNVSLLDTNSYVTDGVFYYEFWVPFFTNSVTNKYFQDVYYYEYLGIALETNGVVTTNYVYDIHVYDYVYAGAITNLSFDVRVSDGISNFTTTVTVWIDARNDPPTNTVLPSVTGTANVGLVLSAVDGSWFDKDSEILTNVLYNGQVYPLYNFATNLEHLYHWQVGDSTDGPWEYIIGETNPTYQVRGVDIDRYVRVREAVIDYGEPLPWQAGSEYTNSAPMGPMGAPDPSYWPTGMVYLTGRWQELGFVDGGDAPNRTNYVSGFYIENYEVSAGLWREVYNWATNGHGYDFSTNWWAGASYDGTNTQAFGSDSHPVVNVSFYDCIKWCNARSEMDGLTPVYYTDSVLETVVRTGNPNITSDKVRWDDADGYRLPTETEWEIAARGGLPVTNLYPWGSSIDGTNANYRNSGDPFDNGTTPVGYYSGFANAFGLFDVAGNVAEWCWDRYIADPGTDLEDPRGPDSGTDRMARGGSWWLHAPSPYTETLRCGDRTVRLPPASRYSTVGFRTVRQY